jgi:DUF883 C-terminal glycine zipper region
MLVTTNGAGGKKDLHVGGFDAVSSGSVPSATLTSMIDPLVDASENYVRNNPWQALGVMAILGVTLGFLMSRRS